MTTTPTHYASFNDEAPIPLPRMEAETGCARAGFDPNPTTISVLTTTAGMSVLIAVLTGIGHSLVRVATEYGTILVYSAFFLWMSISGRLFWWGADKLIALPRTKKSDIVVRTGEVR